MIIEILLLVVLVISVYTDLKFRKILNKITYPAMLCGLIFHTVTNGLDGLKFSSLGLLVGLLVFIIPFFMGGMGAGDVKLMAAIGALKGVKFTFYATVFTGLVGGVIALVIVLSRSYLFAIFKYWIFKRDIGFEYKGRAFPYGVPIAIGTLLVYLQG